MILFLWFLQGLAVGQVMGFTGSGGAVVSIPFLLFIFKTSLKEASILSLLSVILGAFFNWATQKKNTDYILSFHLIGWSILGSYPASLLKPLLPELLLKIIFVCASLLGLYFFFKKPKEYNNGPQENQKGPTWKNFILPGIMIGLLSGLTGIGGGILLVPILLGVLNVPMERALASSLFAILCSSLFSFLFQTNQLPPLFSFFNLFGLVVGILVGTLLVKQLTQILPAPLLKKIRQFLYFGVIGLALSSLL